MLSLQNLPAAARCEQIFPRLKSGSLLSMSQLFDQGYTVNFTVDQVSVTLDKQTIFTGPCDNNTGLWIVQLANSSPNQPKPWVQPPTTFQYTHSIQIVHPPAVIHQAANNAFVTKNKKVVSVVYTHGMIQPFSIQIIEGYQLWKICILARVNFRLGNQASTKFSGHSQRPSTTTTKRMAVYQQATDKKNHPGPSTQ